MYIKITNSNSANKTYFNQPFHRFPRSFQLTQKLSIFRTRIRRRISGITKSRTLGPMH
ncbi:hypothetical protein HanIR_Chr16g0835921 [Helianthus annuus]|nr:hypothetical protein HanIR_Chr16g0835921 [Helianthus annuus]